MAQANSIHDTVDRIAALIEEVAADQKWYVERVCRRCSAPCCLRVHYLYSDLDLTFLRLSGKKRRWSRDAFLKAGCWFLGQDGCLLDPVCRPMLCHRYICPDLEKEMQQTNPELLPALRAKFKTIDVMRRALMRPPKAG